MDHLRARAPRAASDLPPPPAGQRGDHPDTLSGAGLPDVVDESSEEAWARWNEAVEASRNWDSETQPLELSPDRSDEQGATRP